MVGGMSCGCGLTVTVGCSPSRSRVVPLHAMFEVATTGQLVMAGEGGAIVEKVNMRLPPCCITASPLLPVRFIDPLGELKLHVEGGVRIVIDDGVENPVGMVMPAEPRVLFPVTVIVTVYVMG